MVPSSYSQASSVGCSLRASDLIAQAERPRQDWPPACMAESPVTATEESVGLTLCMNVHLTRSALLAAQLALLLIATLLQVSRCGRTT